MKFFEIPLEPEAPEARNWLVEELAKPEYREREANWFDRLASDFWNWVASLLSNIDGSFNWLGLLILVLVIAAVIVVAILLVGRPRINRRSQYERELFGKVEQRSAAEIRLSAQKAAEKSDWNTACEESFRAIARELNERTIVFVSPGTTAHSFARIASARLPEFSQELETAAIVFDRVRYLGATAVVDDYLKLADLDSRLQQAKPESLAELEADRVG